MSPISKASPASSRSMCPAITRPRHGRTAASADRSTTPRCVPRLLELGTRVFEDGVRLMADCLDVELDPGPNGVQFSYQLGSCTKDIDLGWYQLPAGSLGGCVLRYVGTVEGIKRVELRMDWQMTPHTDPHWDIHGCYITKIDG